MREISSFFVCTVYSKVKISLGIASVRPSLKKLELFFWVRWCFYSCNAGKTDGICAHASADFKFFWTTIDSIYLWNGIGNIEIVMHIHVSRANV